MSENLSQYLDLRGKTYFIRMRVPQKFSGVEPLKEINRSLKTRNLQEAVVRCIQVKEALLADWEAKLAGQVSDARDLFEGSRNLLKSWGMSFSPIEDLVTGPIEALVTRIEAVAKCEPESLEVTAALGVPDFPDCSLDEMATRMPILKEADIKAKNQRQRREWCGNFLRAAREFTEVVGKRSVLKISEQDATDYEAHWKGRTNSEEDPVTANYANKQIRYVRQMIDAHFEDIRMPKSKRKNPLKGAKVDKPAYDPGDEQRRKLPLPELWIRDHLVRDRVLDEFNTQASDISIVAAVCNCHFSEIYDISPADIHLDAAIPHLKIRIVKDGPGKRELKTGFCSRTIVLLGPALEAMRRNPKGFDRYRGKASFSGDVNKFLRTNDLLPTPPSEEIKHYVISGLRHASEDRMKAAGMDNEARAFLMGHSIGKVRGRPVYGGDLGLEVRALLQEMVTFETADWKPRPIADLWAEIDRLLEQKGYRIR